MDLFRWADWRHCCSRPCTAWLISRCKYRASAFISLRCWRPPRQCLWAVHNEPSPSDDSWGIPRNRRVVLFKRRRPRSAAGAGPKSRWRVYVADSGRRVSPAGEICARLVRPIRMGVTIGSATFANIYCPWKIFSAPATISTFAVFSSPPFLLSARDIRSPLLAPKFERLWSLILCHAIHVRSGGRSAASRGALAISRSESRPQPNARSPSPWRRSRRFGRRCGD